MEFGSQTFEFLTIQVSSPTGSVSVIILDLLSFGSRNRCIWHWKDTEAFHDLQSVKLDVYSGSIMLSCALVEY